MFGLVMGYHGGVGATGAGPSEGSMVSGWSAARDRADDWALPSDGAMTESKTFRMTVCRGWPRLGGSGGGIWT